MTSSGARRRRRYLERLLPAATPYSWPDPDPRRRIPEPPAAVIPSGLALLAGVWLVCAPFVLDHRDSGAGLAGFWSDILTGAAVTLVALTRIAAPAATAPLSLVNVVLGLWLIASPFVLGYDHTGGSAATWNDVVTGGLVAGLALSIWLLSRRLRRRAGA